MFISTLGKDPSTGHVFDDVYGELIQDILDDETATDKGNSEDTIMEKDEFDIGKVYVDFNLIILNEFSYLAVGLIEVVLKRMSYKTASFCVVQW